jgi:Tol biopolymer transport system component
MAERMGTKARRLLALVPVLVAAGCSRAPSTSVTPSPTSPTPESPTVAFQGQIAFESDRDGNAEIYVMDADGTELERLTDDPAGDAQPAWSPDGTKIAFASDRDGDLDLYVMNADGSGVEQLTDDFPGTESYPAWAPDGTRIAFTGLRGGDPPFGIYVMNADGTGVRRCTDDPAEDAGPVWSPTD